MRVNSAEYIVSGTGMFPEEVSVRDRQHQTKFLAKKRKKSDTVNEP